MGPLKYSLLTSLGLLWVSFSSFAQTPAGLCSAYVEKFNHCLEEDSRDLCEKELISYYTSDMYVYLNATMRGNMEDDSCSSIAQSLKKVLSRIRSSKLKVYRGTKLLPEFELMPVGSCFSDQAFVSTSTDLSVAEAFAEGRALLEMNVRSGKRIKDFSGVPTEEEVLILPQTWFKLLSPPAREKNYLHLRLEEASEKDCETKFINTPAKNP